MRAILERHESSCIHELRFHEMLADILHHERDNGINVGGLNEDTSHNRFLQKKDAH
jgi:hypothetical protein